MGEIISMHDYKLRKAAKKLQESQGRRQATAADQLRERRERARRSLHTIDHPAGWSRHD